MPLVTAPPKPTWVYHFTPIENLDEILKSGGIVCNNLCETQQVSVAHGHIQDRRAKKQVPCGPGGNLHDYVPFYFCPRSPMMYAIQGGRVASYSKGQGELVYLVLTLESVSGAGRDFVFTDRHAVTVYAEFYTDPVHLVEFDWALMKATQWNDTLNYPDRKERKQAEFLVHEFVPWDLIKGLAVMTPGMKERVEDLLSRYPASVQRPVVVRRRWYY